MSRISAFAIAVALMGFAATGAGAQAAKNRTATIRGGGLMYDRGGDQTNLMLAAGVDWTLSRHILAEVEGSWSAFEDFYYDYTGNSQFPTPRETGTHLATATAGVQAQAILGPVRPYVGLATGLFVRYDEKSGGDRFLSHTMAIPAGLRLDISDRIGLRAELRGRFDTHQDGGSGVNLEQTIGVTLRF